ncbi:MAG: hypothetical protein NTV79_11920 [Candidatus Aureabacteria bacterium]|nr:hypothetical protein [Candidatus Auribacterota bacterium]
MSTPSYTTEIFSPESPKCRRRSSRVRSEMAITLSARRTQRRMTQRKKKWKRVFFARGVK